MAFVGICGKRPRVNPVSLLTAVVSVTRRNDGVHEEGKLRAYWSVMKQPQNACRRAC